jgi:hypothetical protein
MVAFECPLCKLKFSTVSELAMHLKMHEGSPSEVRIVEVSMEGIKEVVATVIKVAKNCMCNLCRKAAERARFRRANGLY